MTLIEIVALVGFILGSILHTILSILIIQRKNKKGSELVFLFLVISVAMWHYGNVISLFSLMLFGKNIPIINQSSNADCMHGNGCNAKPAFAYCSIISFGKRQEN